MGALVAEPLYLLADTAVVGHLGTLPLGGLAVASAALLLIYGLCFFLAYGTTATVARLNGAGEPLKASNQAIQSLWLAFFLGIAMGLRGYRTRFGRTLSSPTRLFSQVPMAAL